MGNVCEGKSGLEDEIHDDIETINNQKENIRIANSKIATYETTINRLKSEKEQKELEKENERDQDRVARKLYDESKSNYQNQVLVVQKFQDELDEANRILNELGDDLNNKEIILKKELDETLASEKEYEEILSSLKSTEENTDEEESRILEFKQIISKKKEELQEEYDQIVKDKEEHQEKLDRMKAEVTRKVNEANTAEEFTSINEDIEDMAEIKQKKDELESNIEEIKLAI